MRLKPIQVIDYAIAFWLVLFMVSLFWLQGCGSSTRTDTAENANRVMVREVEEVRQEIHDGQIVVLRTKTRTTEREQTDREASRDEQVKIDPPEVLNALQPLAKAAATAMAGPTGGAAVDWIWQALAGTGALGVTGAAGVVMRERTRRRQLIKAQDAYARDIEQAETDADVAEVKRKHAERQKALGIHEQLTRERHGA